MENKHNKATQHQTHIEETGRENQEIEKKFPAKDASNEDGTVAFPSERESSTEELNPNDQTSMTTETGVQQIEKDYEGFTDEEKNSAEESGEAGGFSSLENDAALEERIADDQNRQGGGVNLKAANEPSGRPEKDESENL